MFRGSLASSLVAFGVVAATLGAQVRVVNTIPQRFGDETGANPEPTLAINPQNPALLVISSFLQGTSVCTGASRSPILVSSDTGQTWSVICKLSTPGLGATPPGDVVLRWSADGRRLYAVLIWPVTGASVPTRVMATDDLFSPDTMRLLTVHDSVDQPDLVVLPAGAGDRLLVGGSYKNLAPGRAAMLRSVDGARPERFTLMPLERRATFGQNYSVRMAAHASGRVYGVFSGVTADRLETNTNPLDTIRRFIDVLDITVVRDDSAGASAVPFAALRENVVARADTACMPGDGMIGVRVARCRPFPFQGALVASFGFQRRFPVFLSIATDPSDARGDRVYVAWADSSTTDHITVNVAGSTDGGRTWRTLLTAPDAINPALAVDSSGRLGVAFQQLGNEAAGPRWVTRLLIGDGGDLTRPREFELASTAANSGTYRFDPYIGDYIELHAVGSTFMGVFSSANHPNPLNFPNGVQFQRRIDPASHHLMKSVGSDRTDPLSQVGPSIDPFFFSVGIEENSQCAPLRAAAAAQPGPARQPGQLPGREPNVSRRAMAQLGCRPAT